MVEALRTPEERQARDAALWTFDHPAEYGRQLMETNPVDPAQREASDLSILDPVRATAEYISRVTPEQRAAEQRVTKAIEHLPRR